MTSKKFSLPFEAINAFKHAEIITDGLTIPFLIGVYKQQREGEGQSDLSSKKYIKILFRDIVNNPNEYKFRLHKCDDQNRDAFGEYVLSLTEGDPTPQINNRLYLGLGCESITIDINNICEYLHDKYHSQIMDEDRKFSIKDGKWVIYSQIEQDLINNILKMIT